MTTLASSPLTATGCLVLGQRALTKLRASLERDVGAQAATYLQEAGFAAGEQVHAAFSAWLAARHGVTAPAELDVRYLGEALGGFFAEAGWGTLDVTALTDGVLALDARDWAEATPEPSAMAPCCHVTCGMLADVLGRMAGRGVAVMEVQCRSRGDERCRFLAGSPETMGALYERLAAGESYEKALGL